MRRREFLRLLALAAAAGGGLRPGDSDAQAADALYDAKPFGNVVKVIATIDNPKGELKTGMTGYAKIGGTTMPVWKAFSLALLRFFNVQVWSWIP